MLNTGNVWEERLWGIKKNLIEREHKEEVSKDIKAIFKFRQRDQSASGGSQNSTWGKFKDGVMKAEGRGYQRGLRTKR